MQRRLLMDAFKTDAGWDFKDCCIEPLTHLRDLGDTVIVTFDLPGVRKEDIDVNVTEDSLDVKAIMEKTHTFRGWGTLQRNLEFKSFHKSLTFQNRIDVEKVSSRFKQGILEVSLPKKHNKRKIKID